MIDEDKLRKQFQESFDKMRADVQCAGHLMTQEAALSYARARMSQIAHESRACADAHTRLAELIEKGVAGDDQELKLAMEPMQMVAMEALLAHGRYVSIYEQMVRDALELSRFTASGGDA